MKSLCLGLSKLGQNISVGEGSNFIQEDAHFEFVNMICMKNNQCLTAWQGFSEVLNTSEVL